MAYINQEEKKQMAPKIKAVLKKFNMKGFIGIQHHSVLTVYIKSGVLNFPDSTQVNQYHVETNYTGKEKAFLLELIDSMMTGNHDNTDIMTDYFDVGWYISISIGKWDKPYLKTAK